MIVKLLGGFFKILGYSIVKFFEGFIDKFCKNILYKFNIYMYVRYIFEIFINNYIFLLGVFIDFIYDW